MSPPGFSECVGAILDRGAGHFQLRPYRVSVPAARRFLPGSLILETTWQTHTGWLVVRDTLVMGPSHDVDALVRRRRTPRTRTPNAAAAHRAVRERHRRVVMFRGRGFTITASVPAGSAPGPPPGRPSQRLKATPTPTPTEADENMRLGFEGRLVRARTRLREGDNAFVALSWSKHPVPQTYDEATNKMWQTAECWRQWISIGETSRPPVAVVSAAQCVDVEGAYLLADRGAAGRLDDLAAGNPSGATQLGLPLYLGARLHVRAVGTLHAGAGP